MEEKETKIIEMPKKKKENHRKGVTTTMGPALCQVWAQATRPARWGKRSLIGAARTAKDSNNSKDS